MRVCVGEFRGIRDVAGVDFGRAVRVAYTYSEGKSGVWIMHAGDKPTCVSCLGAEMLFCLLVVLLLRCSCCLNRGCGTAEAL